MLGLESGASENTPNYESIFWPALARNYPKDSYCFRKGLEVFLESSVYLADVDMCQVPEERHT